MWCTCAFSAPSGFLGSDVASLVSEGKLDLFVFLVGAETSGGADFLFGTVCSVVIFGADAGFGTDGVFGTDESETFDFGTSQCFLAAWPGGGTEGGLGTEAFFVVSLTDWGCRPFV